MKVLIPAATAFLLLTPACDSARAENGHSGAGGPQAAQPQEAQPQEAQSRPLGDSKPQSQAVAKAEKPLGSQFTRARKLEGDNLLFEVSILTCKDPQGRMVDLISAVHIADARHFADLNGRLQNYDALLYELVAPPSYRPYPGMARGSNILSRLQETLQNGLEMAYQVDEIDYRPDHFVHADLTPEGFADEMERRGESVFKMVMKMMAQGQQMSRSRFEDLTDEEMAALPQVDFVKAAQQGYLRHEVRKLAASELGAIEEMLVGKDEDGSTLLEGRNARCIEVLEEQLAAGKKRLGIYYGAAHMVDMFARVQKLGFVPVREEWLVAWDIRKRKDGTEPAPLPAELVAPPRTAVSPK